MSSSPSLYIKMVQVQLGQLAQRAYMVYTQLAKDQLAESKLETNKLGKNKLAYKVLQGIEPRTIRSNLITLP